MTPRLRSDVPNNQSAIGNVRFMLTSIISRNDSRHYFIVMPAGAIAAGMFGGGGHGPGSTPTKAALSEIGSGLAKLFWTSSISAGVICLFIFLSISRLDFGVTR